MSLETSIQNLADAINNLAASNQPIEITGAAASVKDPEHEKNATTAAKSKKKTASKKKATTKKAPEAESTEPTFSLDDVQSRLREIASQITDTAQLHGLIKKHGADKLSDLDPSVFTDLLDDAELLLAAGSSEAADPLG